MIVTFISDTHNKHKQLNSFLPGGDILIHAGDISSMGHTNEIRGFCKWFNNVDNYTYKIFIAGNHDFWFQEKPEVAKAILESYPTITYLQDNFVMIADEDTQASIKIYGSPWQPRFQDWAFNADRGEDIQQHWNKIPEDTDILITHGPAFGYLDRVQGRTDNLGCEDLLNRVMQIKPKIHVCGHIHSGYGYRWSLDENTHFFNAAVLDENYLFTQKPITFDWNQKENKINFK